jgi:hypothetical protein
MRAYDVHPLVLARQAWAHPFDQLPDPPRFEERSRGGLARPERDDGTVARTMLINRAQWARPYDTED